MRSSTFSAGSLVLAPVSAIPGTAPGAAHRVAREVRDHLTRLPEDRIVFACVGTDRSTGDALGPLVGERLLNLGCAREDVFGTLAEPLHAMNLELRMGRLAELGPALRVIAVDAALGRVEDVGDIVVRAGGIRPGLGLGKDLAPVGDVSVTATVNVAGTRMDAQVLQSTRLFLVQRLAQCIGLGLRMATDPELAGAATHAA